MKLINQENFLLWYFVVKIGMGIGMDKNISQHFQLKQFVVCHLLNKKYEIGLIVFNIVNFGSVYCLDLTLVFSV